MGKVEERFSQLRREGKKAFIAFVPFGFPNLSLSYEIIKTLDKSCVDFIEVGLPFSDPLADGPIIQKANQIALKEGADTHKLFNFIASLKSLNTPLLLLTYYNPVYVFGMKEFLRSCKKAGISGIMIVDLPIEEAEDYIKEARRIDLDTIFFATPTTEPERIKKIVKESRGFLYYISVTGTTGPKKISFYSLRKHIEMIKNISKNCNVCVGFGIHTRKQIKRISTFCEGVIVGSAIVDYIERNYKKKYFLKRFSKYIMGLCLR